MKPAGPKPLRGWGAWAGEGIKEKKLEDFEKMEIKNKIEQLKKMKKQRQDGSL